MKTRRVLFLFTGLLSLKLLAAELPTGQTTPEGVACDAILAYGRCDFKAWAALLIRPCYGEEGNKNYEQFKQEVATRLESNKTNVSLHATRVLTCYKARSFTEPEAATFGAADFGFTTNRFVDLVIELGPDRTRRMRYHVVCDKDGKWYWEPRPDLVKDLATRLNVESRSTSVLFERQ